jgi:hypothetical protein
MSAASDGTGLRFTRGDVFDVLADETALLQAVFAGLLRRPAAVQAEPVGV